MTNNKIEQLPFDLRKIQGAKNVQGLQKLIKMIGVDRWDAAWKKLEENPVDAACVAALYCDSWNEFLIMTEAYGVNDCGENRDRNNEFRTKIKTIPHLDQLVKNLFAQTKNKVA